MPKKDTLEKEKQREYLSPLLREIDVTSFLEDSKGKVVKLAAAPTIDIPDIEDRRVAPTPGAPSAAGATPLGQPMKPPVPPIGGTQNSGMPPMGGATSLPIGNTPIGGAAPLGDSPLGTETEDQEKTKKKELSDKDRDEILKAISDIKEHVQNVKSELQAAVLRDEIIDAVKEHTRNLEKQLESLKDRKIPERKFFDTEGTYRDNLYGMATKVLDEFLPELFEEVPNYDFTATQISRTFEDGTIADALISLMVTVPHNGMKYEFKVEVPVLNGLMQYPMYIQRGQKIIPLTKAEIQRELNSMSFRKLDVEIPYEKENIFNNIGENIHRRPDGQKWYEVSPNAYKPVVLPSDHILHTQRGRGIR